MFIVLALIALFAGPWFEDQHTVGLILLIPAAFEVIVYGFTFGIFAIGFRDITKSFRDS